MRETMAPILIYAAEAEDMRAQLAPCFPAERMIALTDPARLDAVLAEDRPEICYAIKTATFPGDSFRKIYEHPALKWFHVGGSGYEHIAPLDRDGTRVTNGAGVLAPFLAETCIAALMSLNHGLIAYRDQQKRHFWQGIPFRPLAGQTLAIVGAGAIGGELAKRAASLGMRVIAIRASGAPVERAEVRTPDRLMESLGEADAVSIHLRLTPETAEIADAAFFAAMKPGSIFLNTARGGHVVEADLMAALASGQLSAAYLDVFQTEPLPSDSPLWDVPNLLMSPHSSDGVEDWVARFTDHFAANLRAWRAGGPLRNVVA